MGFGKRYHNWALLLVGGALVVLAPTCSADVYERPRDLGRIYATWETPPATAKGLVDALDAHALFDEVTAILNARLRFDQDLEVAHVVCREENAFYDPDAGRIRMCYELLEYVDGLARNSPMWSESETLDGVRGTWLFIFFHELGHALIHLYDVPVLGSEEDAVDHFSTLLLLEVGREHDAVMAAGYWGARGLAASVPLDFADTHSLDVQRFYDILCLVYGSDPAAHGDMVADGFLTDARAEQCPHEYAQASSSWLAVLDPWLE